MFIIFYMQKYFIVVYTPFIWLFSRQNSRRNFENLYAVLLKLHKAHKIVYILENLCLLMLLQSEYLKLKKKNSNKPKSYIANIKLYGTLLYFPLKNSTIYITFSVTYWGCFTIIIALKPFISPGCTVDLRKLKALYILDLKIY